MDSINVIGKQSQQKKQPKHHMKILRHGGCYDADGAIRWTHVLTPMEDTEQTWNKVEWIDALCRSTNKPRIEYCEDKNGISIFLRAVQGHCHSVTINPALLSLKETLLSWKEHVFHTGSSSNKKSIMDLRVHYGQKDFSLRSTRQTCLFSRQNPKDSLS